jgi:hypothetical protein
MQILNELLHRSEEYLVSGDARELFAGGAFPIDPFYLGLYGGSELPGLLATDATTLELYRRSGYVEVGYRSVLQRKLTEFRPIVDRRQMQIRRSYHIEATLDPPFSNWWEACTFGQMNRIRFELQDRRSSQTCGTATFWDMEPLASNWGVHAMGLVDLEINSDLRRQGLATFFMGESLRQLQSHGTTLVEVQTSRDDPAVNGLFIKLGFENVDQGIVLRKDV